MRYILVKAITHCHLQTKRESPRSSCWQIYLLLGPSFKFCSVVLIITIRSPHSLALLLFYCFTYIFREVFHILNFSKNNGLLQENDDFWFVIIYMYVKDFILLPITLSITRMTYLYLKKIQIYLDNFYSLHFVVLLISFKFFVI